MDSKQYMSAAAVTDIFNYQPVIARVSDGNTVQILHAIMGIVTEAGELQDAMKKWLIYGKPLDLVNLMEECGDLEWYTSLLMRVIDVDHSAVWQANIDKLQARYPDKFTEESALNRDLDKERKALEGK